MCAFLERFHFLLELFLRKLSSVIVCIQESLELSLRRFKVLIVEVLGRFVLRDQLFVQARVTVLQPVALFTAAKVPNVLLVLNLTFKRSF